MGKLILKFPALFFWWCESSVLRIWALSSLWTSWLFADVTVWAVHKLAKQSTNQSYYWTHWQKSWSWGWPPHSKNGKLSLSQCSLSPLYGKSQLFWIWIPRETYGQLQYHDVSFCKSFYLVVICDWNFLHMWCRLMKWAMHTRSLLKWQEPHGWTKITQHSLAALLYTDGNEVLPFPLRGGTYWLCI